MITAEHLGAVLKKFPYYHMPLEILIVRNLLILYAQNNNFQLQEVCEPKKLSRWSWNRVVNEQNKEILQTEITKKSEKNCRDKKRNMD